MPMKFPERKIKQIAGASGMIAVLKDDETGVVTRLPVMCVALVRFTEHGPSGGIVNSGQSVEGILTSGLFAKDRPGFIGYAFDHDEPTSQADAMDVETGGRGLMTEPTTDRFEIVGRNWTAQEETIEHARKQTRIYDLDPELVEGLLDAYRRQDLAAWEKALAGFLRAVAEAEEKKAAATD